MFCENVLCCYSGSQNSGKQFTDIYCFFNKRVWGWARKRRDRGRGAGWLAFLTEGMDDRECGVAAHRKAGDREFGVDSVDGSGVNEDTFLRPFSLPPWGGGAPYLLPAEAPEVHQSTNTCECCPQRVPGRADYDRRSPRSLTGLREIGPDLRVLVGRPRPAPRI